MICLGNEFGWGFVLGLLTTLIGAMMGIWIWILKEKAVKSQLLTQEEKKMEKIECEKKEPKEVICDFPKCTTNGEDDAVECIEHKSIEGGIGHFHLCAEHIGGFYDSLSEEALKREKYHDERE